MLKFGLKVSQLSMISARRKDIVLPLALIRVNVSIAMKLGILRGTVRNLGVSIRALLPLLLLLLRFTLMRIMVSPPWFLPRDLDQGFEPLSEGVSLAEAASVAEAVLNDDSASSVDVVVVDEGGPMCDGEEGSEDPVSDVVVAAPPLVVDERFNQLDEIASQFCSPSILSNCGPVAASSCGESVCSQIISNNVGNGNNNNIDSDNVGNGNSINDSGNVDNDNGINVNIYDSVVASDDAPAGPGSSSQDSEMSQASGPRKRSIVTGAKNKTKAKKTSVGQLPGSNAASKKVSSRHLPGSISSAARLAVSKLKK